MEGNIRNLIDGVYDIQKLRIATGNRVVAALRGMKEEDADDENAIKVITKEYRRVTDIYVEEFSGKGSVEKVLNVLNPAPSYIKNKVDYTLVQQYSKLLEAEDGLMKVVESAVKEHPMWDAFFAECKGVGPLMAGVCLAYLDPYKARHASAFWKYAGLDVVRTEEDKMEGRQRKHTEMRDYIDKDGNVKQKKSLTYNPFLKTKLTGVLGASFLRSRGSYYGKIYYDYKNRLEQREDLSPVHMHRMATRYAVKMFLRDMWVVWRELEGLPVSDPYEVAVLGHKPHLDPNIA